MNPTISFSSRQPSADASAVPSAPDSPLHPPFAAAPVAQYIQEAFSKESDGAGTATGRAVHSAAPSGAGGDSAAVFHASTDFPPDSNTGVKSPTATAPNPSAVFLGAPSYSVCIDTLTFSFAGVTFAFDVGLVRNWVSRISNGVLSVGGKMEKRYNGYAECWQICMGDGYDAAALPLGWLGVSRAGDNMRGRWCLHLTGVSCTCVSDWSRLFADAQDYGVNITRVDLAADDLEGKHSVAEAQQLWHSGAFNLAGRPPRSQYIQNSHDVGDTFYVGRRESGKQLRVYEKGKQLLGAGRSVAPDAANWVRWEVELRSQGRRIPTDVLLHPAAYLKGAYPAALAWLAGAGAKIRTLVAKTLLSLDRVLHFGKRQVGRLVRYLVDHGMSPTAVCDVLSADPGRYPSRLLQPGVSIDLGSGECVLA